ncbi:hypothetical protein SAMN05660489_04867 [Pseudomonas sp. LAMO17WK12:I10]|uniref:hypothetical protein n=1 Tax=unclassified Pseudomonas TaxID=196821 RepID=UPI000BCB3ABB|nr:MULTISPECIES: hypothetical protein [unclassified Pseudomonas]PXX59081.1 hypothetical protein H160_04810 [Pseudomonas sp. LAMO17WK12:I9]SNY48385.1 hypothetical protein SAMN05660489_04867 [Pseudomonas sp. LAMO17WK12:I10]
MPSYMPIKKGASAERQGRSLSQRPDVHTESNEDAPADDSEAATAKLSSALKSLLSYRKKNTSALKAAPKYQGAGDKFEEAFNESIYQGGVQSDVLARGFDEFHGDDRQEFLEALNYAIDILNIAIAQLRTAEPGGRVEQDTSKVFGVEEKGLNDILDFCDFARQLEKDDLTLRGALIDFAGKRRNQILHSSNVEARASVQVDDPHRRLHVGLGFFEDQVTCQRALTFIHEVYIKSWMRRTTGIMPDFNMKK